MADEPTEKVSYYAGLDLGQIGQFTGLALLERHAKVTNHGFSTTDAHYGVRHLQRFPPGTPYNEVLVSVRQVFAEPGLKNGELIVDQAAVGRAVYELIRNAEVSWGIRSVSITAGHAAVMDDHGGWLVPKKDLVGVLQVLLQNRRIQVAPTLEHATTLVNELSQFQLKTVSIKPDAAIEWRERPHDDLVLAVAISAWHAENDRPIVIEFIEIDRPPLPRWWRS